MPAAAREDIEILYKPTPLDRLLEAIAREPSRQSDKPPTNNWSSSIWVCKSDDRIYETRQTCLKAQRMIGLLSRIFQCEDLTRSAGIQSNQAVPTAASRIASVVAERLGLGAKRPLDSSAIHYISDPMWGKVWGRRSWLVENHCDHRVLADTQRCLRLAGSGLPRGLYAVSLIATAGDAVAPTARTNAGTTS